MAEDGFKSVLDEMDDQDKKGGKSKGKSWQTFDEWKKEREKRSEKIGQPSGIFSPNRNKGSKKTDKKKRKPIAILSQANSHLVRFLELADDDDTLIWRMTTKEERAKIRKIRKRITDRIELKEAYK